MAPRGAPRAFVVISESALILALQTPGGGEASYRDASEPVTGELDPGRPSDRDRLRAAAERQFGIKENLVSFPFEAASEFLARAEARREPPACRSPR